MNEVQLYLDSRMNRISSNYLRDTGVVLRAWRRSTGDLDSVTVESIQNWLGSLSIKPATFAAYAFTLKQFFTWCIANGLMESNPADGVLVPRHRKPFRKNFVSAKTVAMLISDCADPELKFCLFAGFHAGLRFSEVVASKPGWFDLNARTLSVLRDVDYDTKDHTDRDIPLTDAFALFLAGYGLRSPYMLAPYKLAARRHRYRFDFSCRFENYVAIKGVRMTFHDCRRTFASLHVQAGTSVYKVARWLGDDVDVVQRHYGFLCASDAEINRAFAA